MVVVGTRRSSVDVRDSMGAIFVVLDVDRVVDGRCSFKVFGESIQVVLPVTDVEVHPYWVCWVYRMVAYRLVDPAYVVDIALNFVHESM